MIRVSVIVPAYNEEATIIDVLRRVAAQVVDGVEFEVIVADDGSTDGTAALLERHPDLVTRVVRLPGNRGKGGAVRAALEVATGDFALMQDADLEYDPAEYERLLQPVLHHGADIVMGSRLVAPALTRVHYFWHKVGNRFITFLFNVLHNTTFTDIYSGYLLFRRSLVAPAALASEGWDQQAEILSKASRAATVIYEVPISYHGRSYGEGKKIRALDTVPVILMILRCGLLRR